jgi:hypothetical protein
MKILLSSMKMLTNSKDCSDNHIINFALSLEPSSHDYSIVFSKFL